MKKTIRTLNLRGYYYFWIMTTAEEGSKKYNHLKGLTLSEMQEFFLELGEPKFRGAQVFKWIYGNLADNFNKMDNIPKLLREKLNSSFKLNTLEYSGSAISPSTKTIKYVYRTDDGYKIESVVIPEKNRATLCISTQVGCPLDCKFCATGLMGYKKNLSAGEIFDQYKFTKLACTDYNITNIVYMGMGEPLLNYDATLNSIKIFAEELTFGISLKKITISTAGIPHKIIELADSGLKVKLALSLHSCFEEIRSKIMPINKKYSLAENIDAIKTYSKATGTRVTFEYVMLDGINDRDEDIKEIVKLCSGLPSKVNIIPFNSLEHMNPTNFTARLKPSSKSRIEFFANKLRDKNITVMLRNTQGDDIAAACGQLAYPQNPANLR